MNLVILIGRLVADPELRFTSSGIPVGNFRLAVDRPFKNQQGERETDFINIVLWRKAAETASKYLSKGSRVGVQGSLQIRQYQNKEGQNRTIAEVVADRFEFLDTKSGGKGPQNDQNQAPPSEPPAEDDSFDQGGTDLPF